MSLARRQALLSAKAPQGPVSRAKPCRAVKPGRPRVDGRPNFNRLFASILPVLREGRISKGKAAASLGISHRTLNRYLEETGLND